MPRGTPDTGAVSGKLPHFREEPATRRILGFRKELSLPPPLVRDSQQLGYFCPKCESGPWESPEMTEDIKIKVMSRRPGPWQLEWKGNLHPDLWIKSFYIWELN